MPLRLNRNLRLLGGTYMPLSLFVIFALFPFYWMFLASFKSNRELYSLKALPFWIKKPVLTQYTYLFENTDFLTWLTNSVTVGLVTTFISVVIGVLAGYGLARLRFRGAEGFGIAIFISYLIPTTLLFIPLSQVVNALGIANSTWALLVTYPTFLVPFCTWLLRHFYPGWVGVDPAGTVRSGQDRRRWSHNTVLVRYLADVETRVDDRHLVFHYLHLQ